MPLFNSLYEVLWCLAHPPSFRFLAYFWGTPQLPHCFLNSSIYDKCSFQAMVCDNWKKNSLKSKFSNYAIPSSLIEDFLPLFKIVYLFLLCLAQPPRFRFLGHSLRIFVVTPLLLVLHQLGHMLITGNSRYQLIVIIRLKSKFCKWC